MADLFAKNDTLMIIDVSGNQVSHTTSKFIKQICKKNRAAKKVDFSSFRMRNHSYLII
jgi:Ran GTPase-activating protein (RanGAP) involved in mRNA processing and transport